MTIPEQAVERDAEELLARAQYLVDCKYVARSDARQKEMGLAYVEAERADLAREIARFTTNELKRVKPLMGVQRRERDAVRNFVAQLIVKDEGDPAVTIREQTIPTSVFAALLDVAVPLAAPASPRAEGK